MTTPFATARHLAEKLPATLTWTTQGDEIRSAEALHLGRLRSAFYGRRENSEQWARIEEFVVRASDEQIDRVLLHPNIAHLLLWGKNGEDARHEIAAALAIAAGEAKAAEQVAPFWCPSENRRLDDQSVFLRGPLLEDGIGIDLDSPDRTALGSDLPPAASGWRPLDEEMRQAALGALSFAYTRLRQARPSLGVFLKTCTRTVVVRQSDHVPFASFSSCRYIGRTTMVNPHKVPPLSLCEALLHEAIHSYLYMLDPSPDWGFIRGSANAETKILSAWTKRELPLFAFLHACFVWYGLFFFWARLAQNAGSGEGEVLSHVDYTAAGFLRGALLDRIDASDRTQIADTVLAAIDVMQSNVVHVMGGQQG